MNVDFFEAGEDLPEKVYQPSENLRQAVSEFSRNCRKLVPNVNIKYAVTDRDIFIQLTYRLSNNTIPSVECYSVWEESGKVVGCGSGNAFNSGF